MDCLEKRPYTETTNTKTDCRFQATVAHFPKIHRSALHKITIDPLHFWEVYDVNLWKKVSAEVWLIHVEQVSLYNFIFLRKKQWTQKKTKQHQQEILNQNFEFYVVLKTLDLRRPEDVSFATSWRCLFQDALKTSDLRLLESVRFTMSWRRLNHEVLKTCDLRCLEDVWFTTSWRRLIYDVLKTSIEQRLCSNVVATSTRRQNKWFFLFLYCLKYSKKLKCFSLG